jgi:hypothetical protein
MKKHLLGSFMVDFLFGKDMKKFLITIAPFVILLFLLMWFSCGLKGALAFFVALLFVVVAILLAKWVGFVDKHVKD